MNNIIPVLYSLGANGKYGIIYGLIGAIIDCVLVFGAHTRNSTAILVWMILQILYCIVYTIFAIFVIAAIAGAGVVGAVVAPDAAGAAAVAGVLVGVAVVFIILMIGIILFQIWTIIIAKNARREIEADYSSLISES